MSGFLDIGPLSEDVSVGKGKKVTVWGLPFEQIFYLIASFPDLRALAEKKTVNFNLKALLASAPVTLATIMVYGSRELDDKNNPRQEAVAQAIRLPAGVQTKVISTIFKLTFPDGIGPFVEELRLMKDSFTVSAVQNAKETENLETVSPDYVSAALQMDTAAAKRYRPRPVNSRRGVN